MENNSAYMTLKQEEIQKMKRVQDIYRHPYFQKCLENNRKAEESRVFCRHDMGHFMDVARLAYVFSMERGYQLEKEEIYSEQFVEMVKKEMDEDIRHTGLMIEWGEVSNVLLNIDVHKIMQVFQNIFENSIKYTMISRNLE